MTFLTHFINSLPPDVTRIADAIRSHCEVKNKVHWVLDVTFKEDDSRIRKGDGAENVIRRFAFNLISTGRGGAGSGPDYTLLSF